MEEKFKSDVALLLLNKIEELEKEIKYLEKQVERYIPTKEILSPDQEYSDYESINDSEKEMFELEQCDMNNILARIDEIQKKNSCPKLIEIKSVMENIRDLKKNGKLRESVKITYDDLDDIEKQLEMENIY